jgi:hypothetical protein
VVGIIAVLYRRYKKKKDGSYKGVVPTTTVTVNGGDENVKSETSDNSDAKRTMARLNKGLQKEMTPADHDASEFEKPTYHIKEEAAVDVTGAMNMSEAA